MSRSRRRSSLDIRSSLLYRHLRLLTSTQTRAVAGREIWDSDSFVGISLMLLLFWLALDVIAQPALFFVSTL